jgi:hypothetical protein
MGLKRTLFVGVLAATFAMGHADQAVLLRQHYHKGQILRHIVAMTMNIKMEADGQSKGPDNMTMKMSMPMRQIVKSVAKNGDATIRFTGGPAKVSIPGMPSPGPESEQASRVSGTMIMNTRGIPVYSKLRGSRAAGNMMSMLGGGSNSLLSGLASVLPEKSVQVGDSWDIPVPGFMKTMTGSSIKATLIGSEIRNGKRVWNVGLSGSIPLDMSQFLGKMAGGADPSMLPKMDGLIKFSGNQYLLHKSCLMQGASIYMNYMFDMDLSQMKTSPEVKTENAPKHMKMTGDMVMSVNSY